MHRLASMRQMRDNVTNGNDKTEIFEVSVINEPAESTLADES